MSGRFCMNRRETSDAAMGCSEPLRRYPRTQRSWQTELRASPSRRLASSKSGSWPMPGRLCLALAADLSTDSAFAQVSLNLLGCERGNRGVPAKLLVVDDEPRTAQLTAELLRRAGYSVDVASSGTEALELIRSVSPDLMLLDYEMPDMEAPEVLDSLRSGGDRIPFPVIILTGARHSPGDQVVGIERGATDYIVKGTDRQVVLARVRGALRELAAAMHRLRSTLARARAELELARTDGDPLPVDKLLGDLREALDLLGRVEAAAFQIVAVLVLDDDERLAELTARGLRRLGYEAESASRMRALRPREVVVLDLGLSASLDADQLVALRAARPIVVTGASDPASRALADDLGASDYLVKPVELEELAAAIKRRAST